MNVDVSGARPRDIYNLVIGLVAPRPIALVTTLGEGGLVNAAPFSSYNYLCLDPPVLGLGVAARGPDGLKDTARNIERAGEFVVNVVTEDLASRMNICAVDFPPDIGELEAAGLHAEPSAKVSVPRVREAHAALECRLWRTLTPGAGRIILGQVLAIFVEDRFIDPQGPYVLAQDLHALGRMNGAGNYVRTRDAFLNMPRLTHEAWLGGARGGEPRPM